MSWILTAIFVIAVGSFVIKLFFQFSGLYFAIREMLFPIYEFLNLIGCYLLYVWGLLWYRVLVPIFEKLKNKILLKFSRFDFFLDIVEMGLLVVLVVAMFIHQTVSKGLFTNLDDFMLRMPVFYLVSLFDETPFTLANTVEMLITTAFTIVFFKRASEFSSITRYVYEALIMVFGMFLPSYIPASVYAWPVKLYKWVDTLDFRPDNKFEVVLHKIWVVVLAIIIIYICLTILCMLLKEIVANILFSMLPLFVIGLVLIVLALLFNYNTKFFEVISFIFVLGGTYWCLHERIVKEEIELDLETLEDMIL